MSMIFFIDGNILSMNEFCLSESISPTETNFGIDENLSNKKGIRYNFECIFKFSFRQGIKKPKTT